METDEKIILSINDVTSCIVSSLSIVPHFICKYCNVSSVSNVSNVSIALSRVIVMLLV